MAAAALTLSESFRRYIVRGGKHVLIGRLSIVGDYATNGVDYSTQIKPTKLIHLQVGPAAGYVFEPNYSTKKIVIKAPISVAGGAAAAGTDALSIKSNVVNKQDTGEGAGHSAAKEIPNAVTVAGMTSIPFFAIFSGSP